jgi:hypothetical protein
MPIILAEAVCFARMSSKTLRLTIPIVDPGFTLFPPPDYPCLSCYMQPVIDCIVQHISEPFKLNMATAAIALGLMPTLFTFAGTNAVESGLLALQRPILAFLLSAASPTVTPTRTFSYRNPFEILEYSGDIKAAPKTTGLTTVFVSILQYIIALGCLANVAHNSWQLSARVIFISTMETEDVTILYVLLAALIHASGFWALRLRVKLVDDLIPVSRRSIWQRFVAILQHELIPCASQPARRLEHKPESYLFLAISWFTSVGTVLYLFWSTYTFSSALFIDLGQAVKVIVRYLTSIFICRVVIMYELSGMRHTVSLKKD